MAKNIKKNIKVVNGEVKFVKLRKNPNFNDESSLEEHKPKKENFFSKREDDQAKQAEAQRMQ